MPNWVSNTVEINGTDKQIKEVIDFCLNEQGEVDFSTVVPEPETFPKSEGSLPDWYIWRLDNWGTKWNACESEADSDDGIMSFQTAWSCPFVWFKKLSEKFKDVKICIQYYDEDIGSNFGLIAFEDGLMSGVQIDCITKAESKKEFDLTNELFFEVSGYKDEFKWCSVDKKVKYKDEDND